MSRLSFLHLPSGAENLRLLPPFLKESLKDFGDLEVVAEAAGLPEEERLARMRDADVLFTGWGTVPVPAALGENPGRLRWICHLTGEMRRIVPVEIIRSRVLVSNWGDSPSSSVAEGAMTLLLAVLKDLPRNHGLQRSGGTPVDPSTRIFTLMDLRLGLYGFGVIGRRFLDLVRPFGAQVSIFDPYLAEVPEGCGKVASLDELFSSCDAIAIHAGETPETIGTVDARRLSLLPDGGVLINTARPRIVDQEALFAELRKGRLRAGLDVVVNDDLPKDHPIRSCENLIWTAHRVGSEWSTAEPVPLRPRAMHKTCLANVRRFASGEPLEFLLDETRYARST